MKLFGQYSMEIYIMHILFASGVRIVLQKLFGIREFWPHLLTGMAAGLLLPLATLYLINRFHLRFLIQPPKWMSSKQNT
jgi:peptidoglycan/LPS O-acetylase OafA/YrhL